jgi:hypothetical protein
MVASGWNRNNPNPRELGAKENYVETFAEVREFIKESHDLVHDEPFIIGFEYKLDGGRKQSMFVAELNAEDGHRYLRIETTVVPMERLPADKCMRLNQMQRVGYLAAGDLDGTPYVKMCENMAYRTLELEELKYVIKTLARDADRFEDIIGDGAAFS